LDSAATVTATTVTATGGVDLDPVECCADDRGVANVVASPVANHRLTYRLRQLSTLDIEIGD
jgi:hypothetical protein